MVFRVAKIAADALAGGRRLRLDANQCWSLEEVCPYRVPFCFGVLSCFDVPFCFGVSSRLRGYGGGMQGAGQQTAR